MKFKSYWPILTVSPIYLFKTNSNISLNKKLSKYFNNSGRDTTTYWT